MRSVASLCSTVGVKQSRLVCRLVLCCSKGSTVGVKQSRLVCRLVCVVARAGWKTGLACELLRYTHDVHVHGSM